LREQARRELRQVLQPVPEVQLASMLVLDPQLVSQRVSVPRALVLLVLVRVLPFLLPSYPSKLFGPLEGFDSSQMLVLTCL
jgi:hypothetical protein